MFQGEGIQRNNGMAGFDWAIHKGDSEAANSDLGIPIFETQEAFILRDRFDLVEGLSGWKHNDMLTGRVVAVNTRAEAEGTAAIPGPDSAAGDLLQRASGEERRPDHGLAGSGRSRHPYRDARPAVSTERHRDRSSWTQPMPPTSCSAVAAATRSRDLAGNDVIDGDKWLNVRIRFVEEGVAYTTDGMTGKVYRRGRLCERCCRRTAAVAQFGGKSLDDLMFSARSIRGSSDRPRDRRRQQGRRCRHGGLYGRGRQLQLWHQFRREHLRRPYGLRRKSAGLTALKREKERRIPCSDGRDTIRGIEKLQFNGSTLNVIEGTDAGEVLNGTNQADLLVGKGGGDVLNGGDGNDILIGGTNPVPATTNFADNFDGSVVLYEQQRNDLLYWRLDRRRRRNDRRADRWRHPDQRRATPVR